MRQILVFFLLFFLLFNLSNVSALLEDPIAQVGLSTGDWQLTSDNRIFNFSSFETFETLGGVRNASLQPYQIVDIGWNYTNVYSWVIDKETGWIIGLTITNDISDNQGKGVMRYSLLNLTRLIEQKTQIINAWYVLNNFTLHPPESNLRMFFTANITGKFIYYYNGITTQFINNTKEYVYNTTFAFMGFFKGYSHVNITNGDWAMTTFYENGTSITKRFRNDTGEITYEYHQAITVNTTLLYYSPGYYSVLKLEQIPQPQPNNTNNTLNLMGYHKPPQVKQTITNINGYTIVKAHVRNYYKWEPFKEIHVIVTMTPDSVTNRGFLTIQSMIIGTIILLLISVIKRTKLYLDK